ncbi:MAG: hypothetical protein IPO28_13485 [Holophagaceae bacterium]|nr:hypothetical protein [Holophagaceae bacterium]
MDLHRGPRGRGAAPGSAHRQAHGASRRSAREALKLGGVQVDRKRVKVAGKLVKPGIEVRVAFDPELPPVPTTPIPVVFEDEWIIAVDKPAASPPRAPGPRTVMTCWPC